MGSGKGARPSSKQKSNERAGGWHYPEITEALDKAENTFKGARSINTQNSSYRFVQNQDKMITRALEETNNPYEKRVLMSQRRRARLMLKDFKEKSFLVNGKAKKQAPKNNDWTVN